MFMNLPNLLTILRIILAGFIPFLLIDESKQSRIIALIFFTIASITDFLDGYIARKYKLITNFGKILDPIADKIMVLGAFFALAYLEVFKFWIIIPIFLRELIVTVYRFVLLKKKKVIAAEKSGKIKTVMQIITLGISYIYLMHRNYSPESWDWITASIELTMCLFLVGSVYMTIHSGIEFFIKNWSSTKKSKT